MFHVFSHHRTVLWSHAGPRLLAAEPEVGFEEPRRFRSRPHRLLKTGVVGRLYVSIHSKDLLCPQRQRTLKPYPSSSESSFWHRNTELDMTDVGTWASPGSVSAQLEWVHFRRRAFRRPPSREGLPFTHPPTAPSPPKLPPLCSAIPSAVGFRGVR